MDRRNVEIVLKAMEDLRDHGNSHRFAMESYFQPHGRGESVEGVETFSGLLTSLAAKRSEIASVKADCNTAACLAGWTQILLADEWTARRHPATFSARVLDLDCDEITHWFTGAWACEREGQEYDMADITLDHAIRFLRHVLATGQTMAFCGYLPCVEAEVSVAAA